MKKKNSEPSPSPSHWKIKKDQQKPGMFQNGKQATKIYLYNQLSRTVRNSWRFKVFVCMRMYGFIPCMLGPLMFAIQHKPAQIEVKRIFVNGWKVYNFNIFFYTVLFTIMYIAWFADYNTFCLFFFFFVPFLLFSESCFHRFSFFFCLLCSCPFIYSLLTNGPTNGRTEIAKKNIKKIEVQCWMLMSSGLHWYSKYIFYVMRKIKWKNRERQRDRKKTSKPCEWFYTAGERIFSFWVITTYIGIDLFQPTMLTKVYLNAIERRTKKKYHMRCNSLA